MEKLLLKMNLLNYLTGLWKIDSRLTPPKLRKIVFNRPRLTRHIIIIIIIIIKAMRKIPSRRLQMRCPAVKKCSCLYTMYHINNNVFSCVLKVVRLRLYGHIYAFPLPGIDQVD